jgi:two-component system response regulator (stage 0 sporulation protein A)
MNILIVDDDEGFRDLLNEALGNDPLLALTLASSPHEAWWLLSDPANRFDLAIIDIKMREATGLALLKRIRECQRQRHLPVIMCSGTNDRETILHTGQLGANYYLIKPFKMETLLNKVHELGLRRRAPLIHQNGSTSPVAAA